MKTKSRKLNSLPADLRGVADELLADKFPEPEVVEKKKPHTFSGPSLEFPYTDQDIIADLTGAADFSTATTTYKTSTNKSIIDQQSLSRLQRYQGMGNGYQLTLQFGVTPIGQFPGLGIDRHLLMRQLNDERIELTIMGNQIRHVEAYLQQHLKALEELYQGHFHCRLESEEVLSINQYNMYPGTGLGQNY